jgi:regulator of protease activity HflC (stomatin/prohibitin superfamily)
MYVMGEVVLFSLVGLVLLGMFLLSGVKVVRPTHRGVIESKGRFSKFKMPGMFFVLPIFQRLTTVDVTETRLPIKNYPVTTKDGIQLYLDVDVYYKISDLQESVVAILYKVKNYKTQIQNLIKSELTEMFMQYKLKEIPQNPLKLKHSVRTGLTPSNYFAITKLEFKNIIPPEEIKKSYLEKVKSEDEKRKVQNVIDAEKVKAEGLKKIEEEKAKTVKQRVREEVEIKKKAMQEITQTEEEAIKLLQDSWNEAYKRNEKLLRQQVEEGMRKSVEKVRGND